MSITEDQKENERIARREAIAKVIKDSGGAVGDLPRSEGDKEEPLDWSGNTKADTKAQYCGRPLMPWEVLVKGRPIQYRPMSSTEVEAMDEKTMMENLKRQDEAHQRKVAAAIRERDAEQKDMDKRRAHEKKTGKREYGKERFISLEEARRRGLIGNGSDDDGGNNWSSPGNPDGIMCGGR